MNYSHFLSRTFDWKLLNSSRNVIYQLILGKKGQFALVKNIRTAWGLCANLAVPLGACKIVRTQRESRYKIVGQTIRSCLSHAQTMPGATPERAIRAHASAIYSSPVCHLVPFIQLPATTCLFKFTLSSRARSEERESISCRDLFVVFCLEARSPPPPHPPLYFA